MQFYQNILKKGVIIVKENYPDFCTELHFKEDLEVLYLRRGFRACLMRNIFRTIHYQRVKMFVQLSTFENTIFLRSTIEQKLHD